MKTRPVLTRLRSRCATRSVGTVLGLCGLLGWTATPADATHFRYGHITWQPVGGNTIDFSVQNAWRRDAYTTGNGRCINTLTLTSVACTGPGGAAGVGDVIQERQGGTRFDPGDGSGLIGSPGTIGGSNALLYLVTSIDAANNWLFALALDPASLPGPPTDTLITHTYASPGTYTAKIEDCCRISPCVSPTAHINNPDNGYKVLTEVDVGTQPANSSPVSSLPPIILCPINGLCQFSVPVSDNELDAVTFRMSTDSEADFNDPGDSGQPGQGQPGTAAGCAGDATIDSSGLYSWNTVGCTLAGDPLGPPPDGGCNQPSFNTCYSTQVVIEETVALSQVALDFLICLVACPPSNSAPEFVQPSPQCGSVISANPGQQVTFTVEAEDGDTAEDVDLNAVGVPGGATLTPSLPTSGNPVSSTFDWTPTAGDLGQHVMTFTATDTCGAQALCSITIDVSQEDCTDGVDNDDDNLVDCQDPDCAGATCNDGNLCTTGDVCQNLECVGTPVVCPQPDPPCEGGEVCNPGTGLCQPQPDAPLSTPCEADQNLCTADHCNGNGQCVFQSSVSCPGPTGPCDGGTVCNPGTGACDPQPDAPLSTPCELDQNLCTTEHCNGQGACVFLGNVTCNDNNVCTTDACNPQTGLCEFTGPTTCCGDGILNGGEQCDPPQDQACPGQCSSSCLCPVLDHFLCYRTSGRQEFSVNLSDQFDTGTYQTFHKTVVALCTPGNKNGEGLADPATHLKGYRLRGPHAPRTSVRIDNQLGRIFVDTIRTNRLMVPTAKSVPPAPPPGPPSPSSLVDHFRCLTVRTTAGRPHFVPVTVAVADQFGTRQVTLVRPVRLCIPTDKNGEGIENPATHLMCYKAKGAPKTPKTLVHTNNQLGPEDNTIRGEAEFCVPSLKS